MVSDQMKPNKQIKDYRLSFTLRINRNLVKEIDKNRESTDRSRNAEIIALLKIALKKVG